MMYDMIYRMISYFDRYIEIFQSKRMDYYSAIVGQLQAQVCDTDSVAYRMESFECIEKSNLPNAFCPSSLGTPVGLVLMYEYRIFIEAFRYNQVSNIDIVEASRYRISISNIDIVETFRYRMSISILENHYRRNVSFH